MATTTTTTDRTKILAGPGTLFYGAFGATEPTDVGASAAPASAAWTGAGATDGGLTVTVNQKFYEIRVDQNPDIVGRRLTERDVQVSTSLAEGTLTNLALSLNNSAPTTGAGFSKVSLDGNQSSMIPTEKAIIVDGYAPGTNKNRRFIARRVVSVEAVETAYQKDGTWLIPVTWGAMYVDSTTSPCVWIDEA